MTDHLTVALAQINAVVGDVAGNLAKLRAARAQARAAGADLVLPPELAVVGYPPEDLVLKPSLQRTVGGGGGSTPFLISSSSTSKTSVPWGPGRPL